jgi:GntR family transcriptional regulator/MocR family aminotransferase
MRDGVMGRHLRRARKAYEARRDCLAALLAQRFGERLVFNKPPGGLALWIKGGPGVDLDRWVAAARDHGIVLHPPGHFRFDGAGDATRMGFSQWDEDRLLEAVDRLERAWSQPPSRA